MSYPILIDSTASVGGNQFRTNLSSTVDLNGYEVAVGQAFVYYSWYNISAALGNNQFTFTFPTSGAPLVTIITIPDGAYEIADLNDYLQYRMIQLGFYITDNATGVNTYYAQLAVSPTSYTVQFTTNPLPTSLPAGFTSGGMTFPAAANQHPQITIASTNAFGALTGFAAGTYPAVPTNVGTQTSSSSTTPNVSPISAVQIRLSCVYNAMSASSQLLHVFCNRGQRVGELIDASPSYEQFVPCVGAHRELTLGFYDQLGRPLQLLDKNILVKLVFRAIRR